MRAGRLRLAAAAACSSALALGAPESDDKRLFDAAVDDESAGRWEAARDKLTQLAGKKETAGVRFHLGHAAEKLGDPCAAIVAFDRAVALAGSDASLRERAEKRAAQARAATARISVSPTPSDASSTIDGVAVPARVVRCVAPGLHVVAAHAAGHASQSRTSELAAGAELVVSISLAPLPPATTAPPPLVPVAEPRRDDAPRWLTLGAASLLGVASGALWLEHARLRRDTARACEARCDRASRDQAASRTRTAAIATGLSAVATGGLFVALTLSR